MTQLFEVQITTDENKEPSAYTLNYAGKEALVKHLEDTHTGEDHKPLLFYTDEGNLVLYKWYNSIYIKCL